MKITSISKSLNEATFAPILKISLDIPLELMVDGTAVITEEEFARSIGNDLLRQIKIGIAQINLGNPV